MLLPVLAVSALLATAPIASGSLSLVQAFAMARSLSPSFAAARARFRRAKAVVEEHSAAWRPTVGLPVGYVHNENGRFVALNGPDEYTLQAAVHVPIFDPSRDAA
ncbi:MAG: TolC family protein, partial [Cyanobacteria bacterium REEB65]|nr:TolC family protein [Cyanobacteria bacterium REEB65]